MPTVLSDYCIPVVLNAASGTVKDLTPRALKELIESTAAVNGLRIEVHLVEPGDLNELVKKLIKKGKAEIWVGGGDGTVLSTALLTMNSNIVLGILPFGTFNLLARDLGVPLDPVEAVKSMSTSSVEQMDVAEVNNHFFLCAAQFGFFPASSASQGEFHGRQWWLKFFIGVRNLIRGYFKYPEMELVLEAKEGSSANLRTRALTVSNNVYAESLGLVPARESLKGGNMGVYVSRHHSWMSLVKGFVWNALGHQDRDRDMFFLELGEFTIRSRKNRRIPATLDGENIDIDTPLHFKVHRCALQVRKVLPATVAA